ncbi:DNA topoisomerase IB [Chitinophagaceae bacterium LB-8]|uniref:DNA topoisomerase n=1 Tax=Paraflavisolibacter caeni TaxID=2982496 RepID=A0A9X3B8C2_9BACT|nr:DNA topoisomerase IB [Paraflavisolibacter caeni]MCU7549546.1 DNA topoisomerase IB [Paraflavisolibacter caeni]
MEHIEQLSHKEFLEIDKDYVSAAIVAELTYVNDKDPGIQRVKKGTGFSYLYKDQPLKDEKQLERIRKLAIPPAWTNVWICPKENGHIQATGLDARNRKQYRYHPQWHELRNETKFHRLYEFGKLLPSLRLKLEEDSAKKDLNEEKVVAIVISLMERTYIRIGNSDYEKLYGSHGLTTLKDKHVKVDGSKITFSFKGKKGIDHKITLRNRRLAKVVEACREIPGKELFQYYDAEGNKKPIDSGLVNQYIKDATGGDFSAKDFRTWAGTLNILRAFKSLGEACSETDYKKNIIAALDEVSKKLGNTRTVCKKYYVHPGIIRLYEENNLNKYLQELEEIEKPDDLTGLTSEERVLMKILKELV